MHDTPGDTACEPREDTDLEEGEMVEDSKPVTPLRLQAAVPTTVAAGDVPCRDDERADPPVPSKHIAPTAAVGRDGPGPACVSGVAARSGQTGNGRAPPTAPRALREAQSRAQKYVPSTPSAARDAQPAVGSAHVQRSGEPSWTEAGGGRTDSLSDNGALRHVPSTPSAERDAQPAVGSAHAQRGDKHGRANDRRRDRPDSASEDARAPKRYKKDNAAPQLIITSARDLEYGRMVRLVDEKQKRIDELLWQLADSRAELHIYKTRGSSNHDAELRERITKKYMKILDPEGTKSNWRVQELSDLSDDESPRVAATRPSERAQDRLPRRRGADVPQGEPPGKPHEDAGRDATKDDVIYTVGEPLAQAPSCFDDVNEDVGGALAEDDLLEAQRAADTRRDLSMAELRAQTAQVEYGLKFSYTLLLWQEPGSWLPAPLGRFGQPFWQGSSWEDFDPRRLFDKSRSDHVRLDSRTFIDLARDASRIAFFHRSATQRQVVSTALQNNIVPSSHEPDMLSLCRINPARLPIAIRRQYRRSPTGKIFYVEYDAADVGCHVFMTLSGPQKAQDGKQRRDIREQKRAWLQLLESFLLDWLPTYHDHMPEPDEMADAVQPWPLNIDLLDPPFAKDDLFSVLWRHLTTNGMPRPSLLEGGDLYEYIKSTRSSEAERQMLSEEYDKTMAGKEGANQETKRRWLGDRLSYEPVRSGFPVVRVKLAKEKVEALSMKYKEFGYAKKFIPVY